MSQDSKIILATGIYPPDIGGPATFAKYFYDFGLKFGYDIRVITFGEERDSKGIYTVSRRQNIFLRYIKIFFLVYRLAKWADVIYVFDLVSVGIPCAFVKILCPQIVMISRLGGDFQWERAIEENRYFNTLEQYYIDRPFSWCDKLLFFLTKFVIHRFDSIIFNAEILRDIYIRYRGVKKEKTVVIKNILPALDFKFFQNERRNKDNEIRILYLGRLTAFKNFVGLVTAFSLLDLKKYNKKIRLDIIGDGPNKARIEALIVNKKVCNVNLSRKVGHNQALVEIFNCDVFVVPSLTEVNSNAVAEAQVLGKNIILTKKSESYFVGDKSKSIFYIDPLDIEDIKEKLEVAIIVAINKKEDDSFVVNPAKQTTSFSEPEIIKRYIEIYEKDISKN